MANKPIDMKKLRAALRLHKNGHGKRSIAKTCGISKATVKKYINLFNAQGIEWKQVKQMDDKALFDLFTSAPKDITRPKLKELHAFFPYVHKELRKKGVTRKLLWEEYKEKHPEGYMITQFCEHYRRWSKRVSPSMHIEYKAVDKMLVDYSGKKLRLVEPDTGEITEVEVFVSILGASQLIYVEASESQKKADFIHSCENALHYYGGVPQAIVTDNLKSAVTKSHRYEPKLNPDFADFAEYYETAILPTRAYKPKDKALVEGAVKIVYQQVYARIRKEVFHTIEELNQAIWSQLEQLNQRKLSGRPYSRRDFFDEVEAGVLSPLPLKRFEISHYIQATVLQNAHVVLKEDRHSYSVPFAYIRKKVRVGYTSKEVGVYYKYECIATHKRTKSPFTYTTDPEHLASQHKQYTKWNAEFFLKWVASIHEDVETLIVRILEKKKHPEQAYRSCIGVLTLEKKVGNERFIRACSLALLHERYNYTWVTYILEQGLDKLPPPEEEPKSLPSHDNIRGRTYYESNKNKNNNHE